MIKLNEMRIPLSIIEFYNITPSDFVVLNDLEIYVKGK